MFYRIIIEFDEDENPRNIIIKLKRESNNWVDTLEKLPLVFLEAKDDPEEEWIEVDDNHPDRFLRGSNNYDQPV